MKNIIKIKDFLDFLAKKNEELKDKYDNQIEIGFDYGTYPYGTKVLQIMVADPSRTRVYSSHITNKMKCIFLLNEYTDNDIIAVEKAIFSAVSFLNKDEKYQEVKNISTPTLKNWNDVLFFLTALEDVYEG